MKDAQSRTLDSRRSVPIHPTLRAEGFLDYVAALPKGAPLWPDLQTDKVFGLRSTIASKKLSRWLRSLGITDTHISPAHSWRHYSSRRVAPWRCIPRSAAPSLGTAQKGMRVPATGRAWAALCRSWREALRGSERHWMGLQRTVNILHQHEDAR